MNISPRRRRRMMREHWLRQDGHTLEQIAAQLDVSVATVHADLRLLEDKWTLLTRDMHDDLLLQQIARLDRRVETLARLDPLADARRALGPDAQLTFEQIVRIEDRHERRLALAERELRMLLKQLQNREIRGTTRQGQYPDHELADPENDRTNLKEPETVQPSIPSETLEIEPQPDAEKNLPEHPKSPMPRNTGRNKPCPCGSGKKRKHCHPQSLAPPSREAA